MLRWTAVAVLSLLGLLLITDRPGLEQSYFALGAPWEGRPVYVTVGEPELGEAVLVRDVLMAKVAFSLRWHGWWEVREGGVHRFRVEADDGAFLRVDGELLVDTAGLDGEPIDEVSVELEPGFHELELGLFQRDQESHLRVEWSPPGGGEVGIGEARIGEGGSLPPARLYSGRPLWMRALARDLFEGWSVPLRRLLGGLLWVLAAVLAGGAARRSARLERWAEEVARWSERPLARALLLLLLFLVALQFGRAFGGAARGGDAAAYTYVAAFDIQSWFYSRYAHVYLLKLFMGSVSDPLEGIRLWWGTAFAVTVAALAVGVRSVGRGLQVRTLAVVIFLLGSQTYLVGLIGNPFADTSAMMFVTAAVAVYMHGFVRDGRRTRPRHEWHALVVGLLSVGAFRSKEVGAVVLLLPLLFALESGPLGSGPLGSGPLSTWRLDLRRWGRRLAYWGLGAVGASAVLVLLDGLILGDPLFSYVGEGVAGANRMHFPEVMAARPGVDWLKAIWPVRHGGADPALRLLWLGVCAAALAAGIARRELELRLLHLLPLAYLVALIALYVRLPHPYSTRMLIAITPVACLMAGLLAHYAGLDDLSWRRLLSPWFLAPAGVAVTLVVFVLVPYRLGRVEASELLPVALLQRYGWAPEHFTVGVLLPVVALVAAGLLGLAAGRPEVRIAGLLGLVLALFGPGFEIARSSVAQRHSAQVSDLLVYPWRTFEARLARDETRSIRLSRDLFSRYQMVGESRASLPSVLLGRPGLDVSLSKDYPADADVAIASRFYWRRWRNQVDPELEAALIGTARWDENRLLVLMRPREAARSLGR